MAGLFRSEPMARCQLLLQSESAYNCISELGELGLVQFVDLNPDVSVFQRRFVNEVKRCEELERKLRYIEKEATREDIFIVDEDLTIRAPPPRELNDLEIVLSNLERDCTEVTSNYVALNKNRQELLELKHLLIQADNFLSDPAVLIPDSQFDDLKGEEASAAEREEVLNSMKFYIVAGVLARSKIVSFEKMLWRISKGNVFIKHANIEDKLIHPETKDIVDKTVFMIFFQGEEIKTRVKKVCEGYHAALFPCPQKSSERKHMLQGVNTRLEDLNTVLHETEEQRRRILANGGDHLRAWYIKVRKIKAIYHCLNLFSFNMTHKAMVAECWIPEDDLRIIQDALNRGSEASGATVPPILNRIDCPVQPPTFNRTDKYTEGFQNLIDSYGVNTYREVNPAAFTVATFPFLFAVMFGDAGHGLIMLAFALWLVIREEKLAKMASQSEIFSIFFGGRYIILGMAIFSIYTGLIYNDVFAKSLNIFGSHFAYKQNFTFPLDIAGGDKIMLDPGNATQYKMDPYYMGIDPAWQLSENKITFLNTYKMKISLIFGLFHMVFGVSLSLWNKLNNKKYSEIFLEFIPQMVFLVFIFIYLVFLIFFKWVAYYVDTPNLLHNPRSERCAPNLLITFINMMLFKELKTDDTLAAICQGKEKYMFGGQKELQQFLVIVGALMIPIMLFGKPLYIKFKSKQNRSHDGQTDELLGDDRAELTNGEPADSHGGHGDDENRPFSEIMIYQGIHTIEYVLGSVSHTASYLRLWALSLAHSQLSEVLWNMVMSIPLSGTSRSFANAFILYFIFGAWALLSLSILVLMEGLSAFLHTLRLHWVEFQSKFYEGQGVIFVPYSFKDFLKEAAASDKEVLKATS